MVYVVWTTALYDGLPKLSPTVGTLSPLHWLIGKPWLACSAMKCPKTENLLVKLWSMRTISSLRLVSELAPPTKLPVPLVIVLPELMFGKMPAFSRAAALELTKGRVLRLNGANTGCV